MEKKIFRIVRKKSDFEQPIFRLSAVNVYNNSLCPVSITMLKEKANEKMTITTR